MCVCVCVCARAQHVHLNCLCILKPDFRENAACGQCNDD